jgi:NADPH2:quinone reductase
MVGGLLMQQACLSLRRRATLAW